MNEPRDSYKSQLVPWVLLLFLMSGFVSNNVWACRFLEPPAHAVDTLWVHLEGLCFSANQRELAVKGVDVLEALKDGKNLDLHGVLVVDAVLLDQLPLQPIAAIPNIPAHMTAHFQQQRLEAVRVIAGAITIRDSQFEKVFATNLVNDSLVILGEVLVSDTTFLESVDFSKIIFAKPLVFSNVNVEHEGFFIGAQFEEAVDFSHTSFGTHSRFHKAVFRAPVTFAEVAFTGVAEFLEVEFQQAANFSNATFDSGTGFSGSVFHGPVDFSGMRIKREIYFRYSEFRQQASFRQAHFQSVVDFSNSSFLGDHDFSEAEFAVQPEFTASNIFVAVPVSRQGIDQYTLWFIFGAMVILAGMYRWISKRKARGISA